MSEYSYNDIIMDPEDPRLEGAIGKECYFSDCPTKLLESARYNSALYLDCLTNISKEKACPFSDKNGSAWTLIIIKKEEPKPKSKFIPFESAEEFIDAYDNANYSVKNGTAENKLFNYGGIWLRNKNDDSMYMVIEIWNDGVVLGSDQIATPWKYILDEYTFLDSTTCGKEVEDEADK